MGVAACGGHGERRFFFFVFQKETVSAKIRRRRLELAVADRFELYKRVFVNRFYFII